MHMAMKCNYNDGTQKRGYPGFEDTCTPDTIRHNVVKAARAWCSSDDCTCKQWIDAEEPAQWYPMDPCWESYIFTHWSMGSGVLQRGPNAGTATAPRKHHDGAIVLLTTVEPGDMDTDRYVFGVLGKTVLTPTEFGSYLIKGAPDFSLRLRRKDWLPYYSHVKTEKPNRWWGSSLFRYLDEDEVSRYLDFLAAKLPKRYLSILRELQADVTESYDPKKATR